MTSVLSKEEEMWTKLSFMCFPPARSLIAMARFCLPSRRRRIRARLRNYRNLALHRPITSPWQTSSALNSEPSSVR